MMRRHFTLYIIPFTLAIVIAMAVLSCSDKDDEPYPALITELVMASADAQCVFNTFTTDDGRTFSISNTIKGPTPNVCWRFLCGYVKESEEQARIYVLQRVLVLSDYSSLRQLSHDPTGFVSIWKAGGFINLHLLPKTQGGQQAWGFSCDSAHVNDAGGTNHYLSIVHFQLKDPTAYSDDAYFSLDLDSVAAVRQPSDSLILRVRTFDGWRSWTFNAQ